MTEQPVYNFDYDSSIAQFAVSKRAYLETHPEASFKLIATGALVLCTKTSSEPRVLLLQRAASDSNPNKWEPPGGAVDDNDKSILHAAARELWEETGLQAARIGGPVGEPHFFARSNGEKVCRFNFAVHVSIEERTALTAKLNPNEHQQFVWATEREVKAKQVGDVMLDFVREEVERTVLLAFGHS
jgi:8-oxo-dGTP pyrophosphatase MutT (NUDIX family)